MTHDDSVLRQLIVPEVEDAQVVAECIRIARQIRHSHKKIVGLVPASPDVAVPPLALQLGTALVELTDRTIALVDANLKWPFAATEAEDLRTLGGTSFTGRWLTRSLALLAPHRMKGSAPSLMQLRVLLDKGAAACAHVLVDLTGFDRLGELVGAVELCDGVAIVGRSGRTRERELLRLSRELPASRMLGVILVGQEPER